MKWIWSVLIVAITIQLEAVVYKYDVIIYGGNVAGIMAAIQCAHMGKSVALIETGTHVGGMTSGGLGFIDATDPEIVGGLAHNFFQRLWQYYQDEKNWVWEPPRWILSQIAKNTDHSNTVWTCEPHVAETVFLQMLNEAQVPIFYEQLNRTDGVYKNGTNIVRVEMKSGNIFKGDMYIDATYEGDLMASSGVSYTLGREANSTYGEENNGIKPNKYMPLRIDPYVIPGDPSSGLLPRIAPDLGGNAGDADEAIQAYNYRMCLTNEPLNMVSIAQPEGYDEAQYELLFRAIANLKRQHYFFKLSSLPNRKVDANHSGPVSTDYVGMNWDYIEADDETRQRIAYEHEMWQRGLVWTLQNHPRIPAKFRDLYSKWGLAKDEFADNNNWPYQFYVREGRRMLSDYVITEKSATGKEPTITDSIGLASYHMDSHAVKYYVDPVSHLVKTEGGIYQKVPKPFPISYRAVVPKQDQCTNLLVPVCLSASHVAYGSIRMEPVFMILGQSAAAAACLALDKQIAVQQVAYEELKAKLLQEKQVLYFHK